MSNGQEAAALVLVVEENDATRQVLRLQLEAGGFRVVESRDGLDAYARVQSMRPEVVITELSIPHLDGHGLIRKLRGAPVSRGIPILVLTNRAGTEDKISALTSGAVDVVAKPCNALELTTKLWSIIRLIRGAGPAEMPSYHPCFISYCVIDKIFCERIHRDLILAGIQCLKWDVDIAIGAALWREIELAIRTSGKVLLVASHASLESEPVNREIDIVRSIEAETDRDILLVVTLDDYIFNCTRNSDLRDRMIADARGWQESPAKYDKMREKLIAGLVAG
jgi:DNA-binding response OmpR family regulator